MSEILHISYNKFKDFTISEIRLIYPISCAFCVNCFINKKLTKLGLMKEKVALHIYYVIYD